MNLRRIIQTLRNSTPLCDDCASELSGVTPRQQVNQICGKNTAVIERLERDWEHACVECAAPHKILRRLRTMENANDPDLPTMEQVVENTAFHDAERATTPPLPTNEPDDNPANEGFSRHRYLQDNFNEVITRVLGLEADDYLSRVSLEGLIDLKLIISNIHAVVTMKMAAALVGWLSTENVVTAAQAETLRTQVDSAHPFASGFDLDMSEPNLVAEVKGNIPVGGGSLFQAAQLKGLTNDVLQMLGRPPLGKTLDEMPERAKCRRTSLNTAKKFLALYDSPKVRAAASHWMKSFNGRHGENSVVPATAGEAEFAPDRVHVVFLSIQNLPPVTEVPVLPAD